MSAQPRDSDPALRLMENEAWLARRLGMKGPLIMTTIFSGLTDPAVRKQRMRAEIKRRNIADVRVKLDGPLTYAGAFHRLYGEPL